MKKNLSRYGFIFFMAVVFFPGLATAEDTRNDAEVLRRERKSAAQTRDAAELARTRSEGEVLKDITFQAVLDSPDDVETNLAFAQKKIAENELLPASSALERILMTHPRLIRIRLLYAVVLFRLDNLTESELEFKKVLAANPPAGIKNEIDLYMKKIRSRRKTYSLVFRQSNAFQFDDNRNAAPSSKKTFVNDVLTNIPPTSRRNGDTSFINATGIEFHKDLGFQAGHEFFTSLNYFLAEQTEADNLDISAFQNETGILLKTPVVEITPSILMSHVSLSRETFLRSFGGSLGLEREIHKKIRVFTEGTLIRHNYSGVSESPTARERDGREMSSSTGFRYAYRSSMSLTVAYSHSDKNAAKEYNAYKSDGVGLSHQWLLGKGQFLVNGLDFDKNVYEAPEPAVSSRTRREKLLRSRVTYGVPLETVFLNKLPLGPFRGVLMTFTYEYYRSLANITNYTYHNNKYQMMVTKVWEF